jgi:RecA-family ATPase
MLVGGGGLGKSYLALQLMVTLALADNSKLAAWALAFNVKKPRSSAFISLEDPADELHFRLQAIAKHLQLDDAECDTIGSMCSFPTLVGSDFNIADPSWRDDVVSALKAAHPDGLDLLVIDTLSAAHRANETDNSAMGEVMASIGMIGAALGCAVLIIHHVAKDTLKAGTTNTASAARGASATTNRVRYQASVSATDNADILSFEVSKVNGGIKPKPQLWRLVDGAGGVKDPYTKQAANNKAAAAVVPPAAAVAPPASSTEPLRYNPIIRKPKPKSEKSEGTNET